MSASEKLREAAALIREDHPSCVCRSLECPTRFYEAVAALLDDLALSGDIFTDPEFQPAWGPFAVAVACSYIGESS